MTRIVIDFAEDSLLLAQQVAREDGISLSDAVSILIRVGNVSALDVTATPLRGRFALLPQRGSIVTPEHVRDLMNRSGI